MGIFFGIGILALIAILVIVVVGIYNRLVNLKNRTDNAWAQVDVQLKKRADLVPNLVEIVKGYAAHEKGVFEAVTKARSAIMGATGVATLPGIVNGQIAWPHDATATGIGAGRGPHSIRQRVFVLQNVVQR